MLCRYDPRGRPISNENNLFPTNGIVVRSKLDHKKAHTVLSISEVSLRNAGTYKCVVTNGDIVKEEKLTLVVKSPPKVGKKIFLESKLVDSIF